MRLFGRGRFAADLQRSHLVGEPVGALAVTHDADGGRLKDEAAAGLRSTATAQFNVDGRQIRRAMGL